MSPRQRSRIFAPDVSSRGVARVARVALLLGALGWLGSCTTRRVTEVEIAAVEIEPVSPAVTEGASVQLSATVSDDRGAAVSRVSVEWSSDNDSIATVDSDGRVTGRRTGTTLIRASFRGVTGTVSVTVAPGPSIAVAPDSVALFATQGASPHAEVGITNAGVDTLSGLAASVSYEGSASGWLPVSLTRATAPATLNMTATTGGLPLGTHKAVVTLTGNAGNSPLTLPVTLLVTENEPIIVVTPPSLSFEGTSGQAGPPAASATVSNGGGGTLTGLSVSVWYGGTSAGWLSASLAGTAAPAQISVTADATSLLPGTHQGEVRVSSPVAVNSGEPIAVTFVVAPAPERADMALTASGPATSQSGARVEYTLTARNNGPDPAAQVVVTAPIPAGTSFVAATAGSHAAGTLTWNAGTISRNGSKSITVTLEIGSGTTGNVVFGASVAAASSDPVPTNNSAQVTTSVSPAPRADLAAGLTAPPTGVAGKDMTIQVTVQNLGPATASSVVLRSTLPSGVSYRSASGGGSHSNGVVTWSVGTLSAGSSPRSYQLVVRPSSNTSGNVTHSVTASSATLDPTPGNDTASGSTLVLAPDQADVSVTIEGPSSASPGGLLPIRYDITVTNHGPARAYDVDVRYAIPDQMSFVSASRGSVSQGALTWRHSSISSGSSTTTSVYLRVASDASGSIANTVVVTTSTTDPYQVNNSSTKVTSVD